MTCTKNELDFAIRSCELSIDRFKNQEKMEEDLALLSVRIENDPECSVKYCNLSADTAEDAGYTGYLHICIGLKDGLIIRKTLDCFHDSLIDTLCDVNNYIDSLYWEGKYGVHGIHHHIAQYLAEKTDRYCNLVNELVDLQMERITADEEGLPF